MFLCCVPTAVKDQHQARCRAILGWGGTRCVACESRVSEASQRAEGEHRKESNSSGRVINDYLLEMR